MIYICKIDQFSANFTYFYSFIQSFLVQNHYKLFFKNFEIIISHNNFIFITFKCVDFSFKESENLHYAIRLIFLFELSIMRIFCILTLTLLITACQTIGPIFVDYNGVRRDVATWINQHTFLSMQQKRSLVQLSKAQQKLIHIEKITETEKFNIAKQNQMALHCAQLYLKPKKILELQNKIFDPTQREEILQTYQAQFPQIKLDATQIHCE